MRPQDLRKICQDLGFGNSDAICDKSAENRAFFARFSQDLRQNLSQNLRQSYVANRVYSSFVFKDLSQILRSGIPRESGC